MLRHGRVFFKKALVKLSRSEPGGIDRLIILLAGCAVTGTTAPSRFYMLSPLSESKEQAQVALQEECIAIGIGPVEVAEYLNRPQIVTRLSSNELKLAEFDQWAEPLKDNFSRLLAENLSSLLCADAIAVFPWGGSTPIDYRVEVEVVRLDGALGSNAILDVRWAIYREEDRRMLFTKKSSLSEATNGSGYEPFVSAQSRAIELLSREIAEQIKNILP
jgi:uncharacterized lipoprotein YmbA